MEDRLTLVLFILLVLLAKFYPRIQRLLKMKHKKNIKDLLKIDPRDFEFYCGDYLRFKGYKKVKVTKATQDGGIDVIAYKNGIKYAVECKRYRGSVGRPIIQKLHSAAMMSGAIGIVITTGHFTNQAIQYANEAAIILIDGQELCKYSRKQVQTA